MYIADLHIHSKYSRATSKECIPEFLDLWARKKGITLLGTGDFTHPAWRQELHEKLQPAEPGLYTLKEAFRLPDGPQEAGLSTRFVVTGEISSIYKKNGKVRKVHNLILLPSLDAAEELSRRLELVGNIRSDGRPILGLDSRDLSEMTLEACPEAVFIPAHIWTPHFSLFGAFSGFDTIEECFEDLTPFIHALETGLSSDPAMNWRVSALDSYTLISNSDAHSPAKLGREANLLTTELSYSALSDAIQGRNPNGFQGTIEFFPEEGKYHYDGHRNCRLCLKPSETEQYGGKCPVCGKKITIGVQHRVEQLADRPEGFLLPGGKPYESLVPLPEVIAASTNHSPSSVKVLAQYEAMLKRLGSEFSILRELPLEEIGKVAGPCIQEGVRRLREGRVDREPGYDGAYGVIHLLEPAEIEAISGQTSLFGSDVPVKRRSKKVTEPLSKKEAPPPQEERETLPQDFMEQLNPEQLQAVTSPEPIIEVIAGPGTGKTKTLVSRILYSVLQLQQNPHEITAVTFTNKAAGELRQRLKASLPAKAANAVHIGTFHALCLQLLTGLRGKVALADEAESLDIAAQALRFLGIKWAPRRLLQEVSRLKNGFSPENLEHPDACREYCRRLKEANLLDFDDLLLEVLAEYEKNPEAFPVGQFSALLVDEFQDCNPVQFRLLQHWSQKSGKLMVIGDPDQSIYGFRGSDPACFSQLRGKYPGLQVITLKTNYRSAPEILSCALSVISHNPGGKRELTAFRPNGDKVRLLRCESKLSQGIAVAKEINAMVGGIDMLDAQFQTAAPRDTARDFSEIAILYRTHHEADLLEKCLQKESIPYVVAGREDFLRQEKVRGLICFFRFLSDPDDLPALSVCLKLLFSCPEDLAQAFLAFLTFYQGRSAEEKLALLEREYGETGFLSVSLPLFRQLLPLTAKGKPAKLLKTLAQKLDLEQDPAVQKLLNTGAFYSKMSDLLTQLTLGQESDLVRYCNKGRTSGAVTLTTLHGAKGLEFPVVFLCGINQGNLPLEAGGQLQNLDEERRLFYVGMTRAKEELILLCSEQPSPFLAEIPEAHLQEEKPFSRKPLVQGRQLSFF